MIAPDPAESRRLYVDALGLPLASESGDYLHSEEIDGVRHFGIWPLSQAAQACFGEESWPDRLPVPQASIEFEVGDHAAVEAAVEELEQAGYEPLHPVREEPWGQVVARLLSPEGAIVGVSFAAAIHANTNRSAPLGPVIPVLTYPDVRVAVDWLVEVLGFKERVWIGPNHRAQLSLGDGSLIVADASNGRAQPGGEAVAQSTMLRVEDVETTCERARENGSTIVAEPSDFPYGERQCSLADPWGHRWTLTQTMRDVAPEDWGGVTGAA